MLCKCHWIVLYTVYVTAFCLGGPFFPVTVYIRSTSIQNVFISEMNHTISWWGKTLGLLNQSSGWF